MQYCFIFYHVNLYCKERINILSESKFTYMSNKFIIPAQVLGGYYPSLNLV